VCVRLESTVSIRQKQQTATGLEKDGTEDNISDNLDSETPEDTTNPVADQRQHDSCWDFVSGYTITITTSNIVFGLSEGGNTRTHTTSGVGFVFGLSDRGNTRTHTTFTGIFSDFLGRIARTHASFNQGLFRVFRRYRARARGFYSTKYHGYSPRKGSLGDSMSRHFLYRIARVTFRD